jgi:hypothetical protein
MNKPDINRWIFFIPVKDVQTTDDGTTLERCCFLCGKPIKGPIHYYVHLLTDGNLVSSDVDFANSQGFFPIGNDCRKKLPNNFYFRI